MANRLLRFQNVVEFLFRNVPIGCAGNGSVEFKREFGANDSECCDISSMAVDQGDPPKALLLNRPTHTAND